MLNIVNRLTQLGLFHSVRSLIKSFVCRKFLWQYIAYKHELEFKFSIAFIELLLSIGANEI